jgi:hypothetical protein
VNAWHASPDSLTDYVAGRGGPVVAASVEAHLLACATCRGVLADVAGPPGDAQTERRWAALTAQVDRTPSRPLARLGLATAPLRRAALLALVLMVGVSFMVRLVIGEQIQVLFLALAPALPGLAAAMAYRTDVDPAGEAALATPMAGLRVVSLRALLVTVVGVPVGVLVAVLSGVTWAAALAWLMPGVACSGLVLLSGTTRLDPRSAAVAVGGVWAGAVATPTVVAAVPPTVVTTVVAGPLTQVGALALALACVVLTWARRDRVSYRRFA